VEPVMRSRIRALKFHVEATLGSDHERTWSSIRREIVNSRLDDEIRDLALKVFQRLAVAESHIHGTTPEEVHFHEVGSVDSIVDVISVCAGLHYLKVGHISVGCIEIGIGRAKTEHGNSPIPSPAALAMTEGWRISTTYEGESATPTGIALLTALGTQGINSPESILLSTGYGAGKRDPQDHPNIVRVILLQNQTGPSTEEILLETNVDDLEPRLWPNVIGALMNAGAKDVWITPISMKKERSAFTLSVLSSYDLQKSLEKIIFFETTAIGIRKSVIEKRALQRHFVTLHVLGHPISMKIAVLKGLISNVSPEYEDVARLAKDVNLPLKAALDAAKAAAANAGFIVGSGFSE
jgi:uncharacterized protein (TIGR00299 family) protein